MKYAIVSDIHANLQAWKSVLIDVRSTTVDKIICLGDSVGYGPNPAEVLESLHETADHFVLGNHEAALCGKIDDSAFNADARNLISWTRGRLSTRAVRFLSAHPLTLAGAGFRCAHAEFADAGRFCYTFEAGDAMPSWEAVDDPLLFIGHTHRPCIMILGKSGTPRMIEPEDFVLEKGKRFLVNVGSVGQPRDGDTRASYCIFDEEAGAVYWRKIPFDLDAYREALHAANIPDSASPFLACDPRAARPPLREQVPFSPPSKPVRDAVDVQYVGRLERKLRKWKVMFAVGIALAAAAAILGGNMWMRERMRALHVPGSGMTVLRASDFAPESNLLAFPAEPVEPGTSIPNWNLQLGDRYGQRAAWAEIEEDAEGFILSSTNPDAEIRLSSAPIRVGRGMRLRLIGYAKGEEDFAGNLAFALVLVEKHASRLDDRRPPAISLETNRSFVVKEPNLPRRGGWFLAQQTVVLPARAHSVVFEVRAKFKGVVFVRDMRLEMRE